MTYNSLMNPLTVHSTRLHPSVMPAVFPPSSMRTSMLEAQRGTTLYRFDVTRGGAGTMFHAFGIGTSPKQEAMMWLTDGIGTSPYREDALFLADGIGTSPDHERR
jgi:hypothetical protein